MGINTLCWQRSPPLHFPKSSKQRQLVLGCLCPTPVTARLPTTPFHPLPRAHACFKWHPVCVRVNRAHVPTRDKSGCQIHPQHSRAVPPFPPLLFPLFYSLTLPRATEGRSENQTTVEVNTLSTEPSVSRFRQADFAVTTVLDYLLTSTTPQRTLI